MDNIERIHREIVNFFLDKNCNPDGYDEMVLEQLIPECNSRDAWELYLIELPSNEIRSLFEELKGYLPKRSLRKELDAILKEVVLKKITSSMYVSNKAISNIASCFVDWKWVRLNIDLLHKKGRKFAIWFLVWDTMPERTDKSLQRMRNRYHSFPHSVDGWIEGLAEMLKNQEFDLDVVERKIWRAIKQEIRSSCK